MQEVDGAVDESSNEMDCDIIKIDFSNRLETDAFRNGIIEHLYFYINEDCPYFTYGKALVDGEELFEEINFKKIQLALKKYKKKDKSGW